MGKYYLTTAIDYVNSVPHVGTSYEKILADVIARWNRLKGDDVFFLMGNDEHSQQVADKAAGLKLDPRAYCDQMEEKFRGTWKKLDISYDRFIRTTEPAHAKACQEIFLRLQAKGDIRKMMYRGLYCIGCEARKTEADLVDGKCPNHPDLTLKRLEEENYFFLLSKYADPVRKLISKGGFIEPAFRENEMLSMIDQGLEDISISRRTTRWGVPIPGDPDQVMYVWFDALINYVTAPGFPGDPDRFGHWWPADLHVIGKDITKFHAVIWPAMLLSAGIPPPKKLAIHGFVYIGGRKISKTQNEKADPQMAIMRDPIKLADKFGADTVRYFLLREVAFGQDGEISYDKLTTRHNSDLADILGNLLNRVVSMTDRYLAGTFSSRGVPLAQDASLRELVGGLADRITPLMDRFDFHTALGEIWKAATATNGHIEATAPWKLAKAGKSEEVAGVLVQSAEALRILAILLSPFVPTTSRRILEQLGIPDAPVRLVNAREWDYIRTGVRVQKGSVLFQKIDVNAEQL